MDIPWTMVDGDLNLQRLIFRKDNSLYIVREGEIQESRWEYLPAMNSLVIEIGGKKILMNEVFADGKALILKKDGVSLDFLSFANQNELPDLNLEKYFKRLTIKETSSLEIKESRKMKPIPHPPINKVSQNPHTNRKKSYKVSDEVIYFLLLIVVFLAVINYLANN
ncbi:hypothetical protein OU792_15305 [Algoriphagus sp. NF]|uniref:hypothetical protein n=1 Tax=Algoriphagus sp. NF TaxID=2992756 RepID=UPI00237AD98C|nr:hypothetical protein [Algoriphagus sp. NF]MDE0561364.1 hypothetical protein [Algoriphagus sp. NF]